MEKFIPYDKLSKKEKRKLDSARRGSWGNTNPVTRKPENSRAYNRRKALRWEREERRPDLSAFLFPGLLLAALHGMIEKNHRRHRHGIPRRIPAVHSGAALCRR